MQSQGSARPFIAHACRYAAQPVRVLLCGQLLLTEGLSADDAVFQPWPVQPPSTELEQQHHDWSSRPIVWSEEDFLGKRSLPRKTHRECNCLLRWRKGFGRSVLLILPAFAASA